MIGWTAADLAESGYLGLDNGIEQTFGKILGSEFDLDRFAEGLGEHYLIERNYFKFHACGRHIHPTLDAFDAILADGDVTADNLQAVEVETYFPASRKKAREVRTSLDARVSIPYAIASRLVVGTTSAPAYSPEALRDPQIQRLMQLVTVTEDPRMTEVQPGKRQARVRVTLTDGRTFERHCLTQPRGEFDEPLEPDAVETKFLNLTTPHLGMNTARVLWGQLLQLEQSSSLRDIIRSIRPERLRTNNG
jgi:2-methylcitrate dehydratase PrpD